MGYASIEGKLSLAHPSGGENVPVEITPQRGVSLPGGNHQYGRGLDELRDLVAKSFGQCALFSGGARIIDNVPLLDGYIVSSS